MKPITGSGDPDAECQHCRRGSVLFDPACQGCRARRWADKRKFTDAMDASAAELHLTDIQIDQLAADQAEQMHVCGGYVLTVPMLRRLLAAAAALGAAPQSADDETNE